jgi:hypothetical protein
LALEIDLPYEPDEPNITPHPENVDRIHVAPAPTVCTAYALGFSRQEIGRLKSLICYQKTSSLSVN